MLKLIGHPHGNLIKFDAKLWAGGEQHIRIHPDDLQHVQYVEIKANIYGGDDLMQLVMVVDALRRQRRGMQLALTLPYFPYARQDRVCNPGEPLGVAAFAAIINSLDFIQVEIWDAHSDVTPALIKNVVNIHCKSWVRRIPMVCTLIAPDVGATKKVKECSRDLSLEYVTATKVRDPQTGELSQAHIDLSAIKPGIPLMIVDDICDGGRTFINLAKVIGQRNPLYLYVTHGIFSYGTDELKKYFNKIYTANAWPRTGQPDGFIKEIKI